MALPPRVPTFGSLRGRSMQQAAPRPAPQHRDSCSGLAAYVGKGEAYGTAGADRPRPREPAIVLEDQLDGFRSRAALAILFRMRTFTAVIERDQDTGLYVGFVPGWPGAHSQGATMEELQANLQEVIAMLLEDGEPKLEAEFVGTHTLQVA